MTPEGLGRIFTLRAANLRVNSRRRGEKIRRSSPPGGHSSQINGSEKNMFSLIWILIVGLVVGALAKLIMPGRDPGGIFVTMMLGVAGALVGRLLGRAFGMYAPGQPP